VLGVAAVKPIIEIQVVDCLVSMDEATVTARQKESIIAGSRLYLFRLVVRFVTA
jgi:hypothetical protein